MPKSREDLYELEKKLLNEKAVQLKKLKDALSSLKREDAEYQEILERERLEALIRPLHVLTFLRRYVIFFLPIFLTIFSYFFLPVAQGKMRDVVSYEFFRWFLGVFVLEGVWTRAAVEMEIGPFDSRSTREYAENYAESICHTQRIREIESSRKAELTTSAEHRASLISLLEEVQKDPELLRDLRLEELIN